MATYKRNKSGVNQNEVPSNSASPASSNPSTANGTNNNAPKYGTVVPNRIFVGGIASNTTETELTQLFSKYGNVTETKIIVDRGGVSKGYGFVTFDTEEEVKCLIQDSNNIVLKERKLNIAPAVKKQLSFSRSFDTSSPPPSTPNLYYHNGVPYTFHNGMAFFTPNAHQTGMTALPPTAEPPLYSSAYGPSQSAGPTPSYGTPLLVPAQPPVFMPQGYSYQHLPMTNNGPPPFVYTGTGSANGNAGPSMAATPDMTTAIPPPYYSYPPQEAYYQPAIFIYPYNGEYEGHDQQIVDGRSSTATTPHSDVSERSSNKSPANTLIQNTQHLNKNLENNNGPHIQLLNAEHSVNKTNETNPESQVPVVSWQTLKNQAEEREMCIRGGRRAFYPIVPPLPTPPRPPVLLYHQAPDNGFAQRQSTRYRQRPITSVSNSMPFIPKFPASFNNNNPHTVNNNIFDTKSVDLSNGKPSQKYPNNRQKGSSLSVNRNGSSPPNPVPNPSDPFPSPQIMQPQYGQQFDRPYIQGPPNMGPRWTANPQAKRLAYNKRQHGSSQNMAVSSDNNIRLVKKPPPNMVSDLGGGGDAQPIMQLALTPPGSPPNTKMQSLSLKTSC